MKYIIQSLAIFIVITLSSCGSSRYYTSDDYSNNYSQSQGGITYQQFYNDLSPYGNWINYPGYGYVWMPRVAGFRPYYSNGRWAYTNYGWTWASDYSWGWAPFHYGRWMHDRGYGWMWIPGYEWAPAWVAWRGGGDYYGWAPLGPGMNNYGSGGNIPYNNWAFVPQRYMNSPRINNYYVNQSRNVTIINNTTIINSTTINNGNTRSAYNAGPPVREVERSTGAPIRRLNVVESSRPGNSQITNNAIRVYRPTIQQNPSNAPNIRPARVTQLDDIDRNNNSNSNAPVREFPKGQAPQINRNEPPVNNGRPSVSPERNNAPVRRLPDQNQPAQTERNAQPQNNIPREEAPVNNERPPISPERNSAPVRTLPNQNAPVQTDRNSPSQNNIRREEAPVRSPRRETQRPAEAAPQRNNPPANSNDNPAPVRQFDNSRNNTRPTNSVVPNSETPPAGTEKKAEQVRR